EVLGPAVAELELVLLEVGVLDLVLGAEPVLGVGAGLDVDEPGLHHAAPVPGGHVQHVGDAVRPAVVHDDHADLELGGRDHPGSSGCKGTGCGRRRGPRTPEAATDSATGAGAWGNAAR